MPGKEIKGRSKRANYRHGGRIGKQFGGPLAQPGVAPVSPLAQPGVAPVSPLAQPGVAPVRPLGFKKGARVKKAHGGKSKK